MSDDDFLARWSRRKRAAARSVPQEPKAPEEPAPPSEQPAAPAAASAAPAPAEDEVDLASLPSLESITADTDITGFLRRGVPEELTRSALRKMWSSDPAIRDFIGIAENQWDFNDPASIPGFGPIDLSPEQVRQMAAKLVGDVERVAGEVASAVDDAQQQAEIKNSPPPATEIANASPPTVTALQKDDVAAQQEEKNSAQEPAERPLRARRHGGALPS
jgi:hypothetical protein